MATHLYCNNGHELRLFNARQLASESPDYRGGYACDLCGVTFAPRDGAGYPARHCPICRYDLCPACAPVAPVEPPRLMGSRPPPRPRPHLMGRVVAPRPPRSPPMMLGDVAPMPEPHPPPPMMGLPPMIDPDVIDPEPPEVPVVVPPADEAGVSHEWRGLLTAAGISVADLRSEATKAFVFETVRGLIPDDRRPERLTSLPPIANLGCSSHDAMMTLKMAWQFRTR